MNNSTTYRQRLTTLLGKRRQTQEQLAREQQALRAAEAQLSTAEESLHILQEVAKTVQEHVHTQIATVVSRCLGAVFADPYTFRINFHKARGKTEAEMVFVRNGKELDPLSEAGGGTVDIASLALRLACLVLVRPKRRRLLVLDEPLKNVHGDENRQRAAELIEALAENYDMQFILMTGLDWLQIGHVVEL